MSASRDPLYVCGHTRGELERLEIQGRFYEAITRALLIEAGLAPGMRVLDIGCGAGDVSFLAAEIVGLSGSVLGIDHAPEAIGVARSRAPGRGSVEFRVAEIGELTTRDPFDALLGRFVLMHQAAPARTLRGAAALVRPGGVVAMLESDLTASLAGSHSHPRSPTYDRVLQFMVEVIRAAGAHPDMGLRLRRTFLEAGLPSPELFLQGRVEGGEDAAVYRYMAESVRSMLPLAEALGAAAPSNGDVAALETHLRDEVTASGGVLVSPLVVGAWCRLP